MMIGEELRDLEADEGWFKDGRVLVTGGAGFIGSWLCDALTRLGSKVLCLDNFSTGRMENIKHLLGREDFKLVKADIAKVKLDGSLDAIIHGASVPNPDDYVRRPVDAMLPNSLGLLNVLEKARSDNAVVLYLSTSEVYGDPEVVPTPETYWGRVNPIGERSPYEESKRFGEALCMSYVRQYGVDVRIVRLFNTYGPRIDPEAKYARVIPKFIMQALKGEPITVHGDGEQTRSFMYIKDAVTGILRMLQTEVKGEIVNLGSLNEIKIIDLAKIVKKLTGSKSPITHTSPRPDDPKRRCPNIEKARRILGWEPKVKLEEGLTRTIAWFKEKAEA